MSTPATNLSALQALIAARKAQVSRQKTIKPEAGRNRYRVLPSWRGTTDAQFYLDFGQHFIKDALGKVKAVYVCVHKTFGRPCDVCDAIDHAIHGATDDLTIQRLKEAQSGSRVLLNVLDRSGKPGVDPNQPQILEVPPSVFNGKKGVGGILSLMEQTGFRLLNFADGYDVIIEKSGAGKEGTSYGVSVALDTTAPVDPKVMERIHNLDNFVAQENVESHTRALSALGVSVGAPALAAPSRPAALAAPMGSIPAAPAASLDAVQEEALRTIEGTATLVPPAAAPVAAPAAPAAPVTPAPQPAPVAQAAPVATPPAAAPGTDPELEKLLGSI